MSVNLIYNGNFDICNTDGTADGWSITGGTCQNGAVVKTGDTLTLYYKGFNYVYYTRPTPSTFSIPNPPANTGYSYAIPVVLYNYTTYTVLDYQVLLQIDTAYLISQGMLASNCSDLAFYDPSTGSFLPYWIERGCNTSSTLVWVRVSNITYPVKVIYMLTGSTSPTQSPSIDATFIPNQIFATSGSCANPIWCNYADNAWETYHGRIFSHLGNICSKYVDKIYWGSVCDGSSPNSSVRDNFWSRFRLLFVPLVSGTWNFAVDSDDASDLWTTVGDMYAGINFGSTVVASWYGGHGWCNCQTYSGSLTLNAGQAIWLDYWQQEWGGSEAAVVWVQPPGGSWAYLSNAQTSYYKVYARRYVFPEIRAVIMYDKFYVPARIPTYKRSGSVVVAQTGKSQKKLGAYVSDVGLSYAWATVKMTNTVPDFIVVYHDRSDVTQLANVVSVSTEVNGSYFSFGSTSDELYVQFPWSTSSATGWYGRYVFTHNLPSDRLAVSFTIRDDYSGSTAGYINKQIVVDTNEVYSIDVAYSDNYRMPERFIPVGYDVVDGIDFSYVIGSNSAVKAGQYHSNVVGNFGVRVYIGEYRVYTPPSRHFELFAVSVLNPTLVINATGATYISVNIKFKDGTQISKTYNSSQVSEVLNATSLPDEVTVTTDASSVDEVSLYQVPTVYAQELALYTSNFVGRTVYLPTSRQYIANYTTEAYSGPVVNTPFIPNASIRQSTTIDLEHTQVYCTYSSIRYYITVIKDGALFEQDGFLYIFDPYVNDYVKALVKDGKSLLCLPWMTSLSGVHFARLGNAYYSVTTKSMSQKSSNEYYVTIEVQSKLVSPVKWTLRLLNI